MYTIKGVTAVKKRLYKVAKNRILMIIDDEASHWPDRDTHEKVVFRMNYRINNECTLDLF